MNNQTMTPEELARDHVEGEVNQQKSMEIEEECKQYLHSCIKYGALDWHEAEEIVKNKDWKQVYDMMRQAEKGAEAQRKGEW